MKIKSLVRYLFLAVFCTPFLALHGQEVNGIELLESDYLFDGNQARNTVALVDGSISLLSADSIRAVDERQILAPFLRKLKRRISYNPALVAESLQLRSSQLMLLYQLLEEIEKEDESLVQQRLRSMCRFWRQAEGEMPALERANYALEKYTELETAEYFSNKYRQNIFYNVAEKLGIATVDRIRQDMASYGSNSYAGFYSWESLVHTVGNEVEQLEYSCQN